MTTDIFDSFCFFLTENNIATQDEINLACSLVGRDFKTFYDIIYIRTGLRSFEQLKSEGYYIPNDELFEYDKL